MITGGQDSRTRKIHYGYVVFIGACLMMLPEALPINTASIFYTPVTAEFGIDVSTFSIHTTIISLSIFLMTSFMTRLFNRFDIRIYMSAIIAMEAMCFFAYSLARNVWVFYVSSFFIGASLSVLVYLVVPVLVNNWFSVRTGLFIGIGACMQGIGGAIFNSLGALVIQDHGWRACYVMFGVVTLLIGIPISIFVLRKRPSDMGLQQIGRSEECVTDAMPVASAPGIEARKAYRSAAFFLIVAACLCLSTGIIFNYYLNSYVLTMGFSIPLAGVASSMVMVGMCIGKVAVGAISDKNIRLGVSVGCGCGVLALVVLAAWGQAGLPIVYVACLMFGIAYASSSLLGAVLTRHAFGPKDFGVIWPTVGRFIALGNAFGATFWGFVVQNLGYRPSMLVVAGVILAAMVFAESSIHASKRLRDSFGS